MAATKTRKYGDGVGNYTVDIDSDVQTNPHTTKPIVQVFVNGAAYAALHTNAKTDIRAVTIGDVIDLAFT